MIYCNKCPVRSEAKPQVFFHECVFGASGTRGGGFDFAITSGKYKEGKDGFYTFLFLRIPLPNWRRRKKEEKERN